MLVTTYESSSSSVVPLSHALAELVEKAVVVGTPANDVLNVLPSMATLMIVCVTTPTPTATTGLTSGASRARAIERPWKRSLARLAFY
jgi:hypothetical protein